MFGLGLSCSQVPSSFPPRTQRHRVNTRCPWSLCFPQSTPRSLHDRHVVHKASRASDRNSRVRRQLWRDRVARGAGIPHGQRGPQLGQPHSWLYRFCTPWMFGVPRPSESEATEAKGWLFSIYCSYPLCLFLTCFFSFSLSHRCFLIYVICAIIDHSHSSSLLHFSDIFHSTGMASGRRGVS
jgi:hypothetical protein